MGQRIFITGGGGFIGSHVVDLLVKEGHDVMVFDMYAQYHTNPSYTYTQNMRYRQSLLVGAKQRRGDVTHSSTLRNAIYEHEPDVVLHLAALPLANISMRQPDEAFYGILKTTFTVLETLRSLAKPCKLIYTSSSMVYGDFTQDPMREDGPKRPKDVYGSMKYAGELICKAYAERYNFPLVIIRPSAVYGPGDNNRRVVQIFVENAVAGDPIYVKNPKTTFLDFTYVKDLADGIFRAVTMEEANGFVFNLTRGEAKSLEEVVSTVAWLVPCEVKVEVREEESWRPERGALDISQARRILGYDPKVSLVDGIKEYIKFVMRHDGRGIRED